MSKSCLTMGMPNTNFSPVWVGGIRLAANSFRMSCFNWCLLKSLTESTRVTTGNNLSGFASQFANQFWHVAIHLYVFVRTTAMQKLHVCWVTHKLLCKKCKFFCGATFCCHGDKWWQAVMFLTCLRRGFFLVIVVLVLDGGGSREYLWPTALPPDSGLSFCGGGHVTWVWMVWCFLDTVGGVCVCCGCGCQKSELFGGWAQRKRQKQSKLHPEPVWQTAWPNRQSGWLAWAFTDCSCHVATIRLAAWSPVLWRPRSVILLPAQLSWSGKYRSLMLSFTALDQPTQISSVVVSATVASAVSVETEKKFAMQFQPHKAPNCKTTRTKLSQRLMADFKYPLLTSHNLLWRRILQTNTWWHKDTKKRWGATWLRIFQTVFVFCVYWKMVKSATRFSLPMTHINVQILCYHIEPSSN